MSNHPNYIKFFSDTHLDFETQNKKILKVSNPLDYIWAPVPNSKDKETILVLGGDIWLPDKPFCFRNFSWMGKIAKQFHSVVYVLGNHDIYGDNISYIYEKNRKYIKDQNLSNVYLLQNEAVDIGEFRFVGTTLWTDLKNADPLVCYSVENTINDYKKIRCGPNYRKLKTHDTIIENKKASGFLKDNSKKPDHIKKLIAVTHFPPIYFPHKYGKNIQAVDYAYLNHLENLILDSDFDHWIFGHTHQIINYKLGGCQLMSNVKGYFGHESIPFTDDVHIYLDIKDKDLTNIKKNGI